MPSKPCSAELCKLPPQGPTGTSAGHSLGGSSHSAAARGYPAREGTHCVVPDGTSSPTRWNSVKAH